MIVKWRAAVRRMVGWGITACILLLGTPALADPDLQGSRALAMGGSVRAMPSSEAAVFLNPAGMSLARAYQISGIYQYRGSDSASLVSVAVVDSITARLAAGLYYAYSHASPDRTVPLGDEGGAFALEETLSTHAVGLALSYPIADFFYLGLTTKYTRLSIDQPEDIPEAMLSEEAIHGVTMDVGSIMKLGSSFNIAITGYNLIPIDAKAYPRLLGLGASYAAGTRFSAEFDSVLDFTSADEIKPSYHGGLELFLANSYAVRGGVLYDTLRQATYVAGGLGIVSPKIALEFGLRQMVDGGSETMIACSLRLAVL